MIKISTSILSSVDRKNSVEKLNETNTDYLHLDIMDGSFVEKKEFSIKEIDKLIGISNKKIDAHLMVNKPIDYLEKMSLFDIEYFTFHIEVYNEIDYIIKRIKECGFKVGISISPKTEVAKILPYIAKIDMVLVMSVEPGLGGQSFMIESMDKVKVIREYINNNNLNTVIEIDGGIKDSNIDIIKDNGVDIAVVGSFIINSENYQEQINKLKG